MRRRERITEGTVPAMMGISPDPSDDQHSGVVCWVCSVASIISHCGSSSRLGNGCLGTWPVVSSFLCHLFSSFMEELPAAVLGAVPLASFAVCVCAVRVWKEQHRNNRSESEGFILVSCVQHKR